MGHNGRTPDGQNRPHGNDQPGVQQQRRTRYEEHDHLPQEPRQGCRHGCRRHGCHERRSRRGRRGRPRRRGICRRVRRRRAGHGRCRHVRRYRRLRGGRQGPAVREGPGRPGALQHQGRRPGDPLHRRRRPVLQVPARADGQLHQLRPRVPARLRRRRRRKLGLDDQRPARRPRRDVLVGGARLGAPGRRPL